MMQISKQPSRIAATDLARLRHKLEQKRDALLASQVATRERARAMADGAIEDADIAEGMIEQETALRQDASERHLLDEIEHALRKVEDGTYGTSEDSGAPIEIARLDAMPWTRRTADEEQFLSRWGVPRKAR
jgi:DnaK suppressor protein